DRGRDLGDVADLGGEVRGHRVDVVREVPPGAGDAPDLGLPAEPPLGADLAGDPGDLGGKRGELVDHRVDGALELQDLAARVDDNLLGQVTGGDSRGDLGDVADLAGQVRGHRVDVVGQVPPHAGDPPDLRLTTELALGPDLAGDAGHLVGTTVNTMVDQL